MYRRAIVPYCGDICLEEYSSVLVKKNEVVLKITYAYLSVIDIAINNCDLIAKGVKTLGSIAVGKVVDTGTTVEDVGAGSRAIVFAIHVPQYIDSFGGAQDLISVEKNFVKIVKLADYDDKELLILAGLSVNKEVLDVLKGKDVLLVGEDISILTLAYYAQKLSCKVGIVPKHTAHILNTMSIEHVSVYNSRKYFDVIVIATYDPLLACLTVKNHAKERGSKILMYPYTHRYIANVCMKNNGISMETMTFGDIEIGIEVFNVYRSAILKTLKVLEIDRLPTRIREPLIVRLS